jgi:hypothetical protein
MVEQEPAQRGNEGWRLVLLGAAAVLLAGLAFDAWSRRGGASVGVSGDLGQTFLGVGATVVVVGAAVLVFGPGLRRHSQASSSRFLQVALPIAAVSVLGPAMVVASASARPAASPSAATDTASGASAASGTAHDHGAASSATTGTVDELSPAAASQAASGQALAGEITGNTIPAALHDHGHGSTVYPDQPMDVLTRAKLGQQLEVARAVALRYPTVADATRAGYIMVTPFVPLIGAHYLNLSYTDDRFDPAQPEMLLYDGTKPTSRIVGLSYFVRSTTGEPAGFAGPNDHWHQHIGLCIRGTLVVGGESITPEECTKRGGNKVALSDMWMVHVWVVPGWESPQGVFSPEQDDLLKADT